MAVLYAQIERLITSTGLEWTFVRPGMFGSNALHWWAPAIRAGEAVRWPYGAAETAPVDERDVAAVAALSLWQDGHAGGDYVLTGPEPLSQAEQVGILAEVLQQQIPFEELSPQEFRRVTLGKLAGTGRRHAARRLERDDGNVGAGHDHRLRHPRCSATIVPPVVRRQRGRVLAKPFQQPGVTAATHRRGGVCTRATPTPTADMTWACSPALWSTTTP